MKSIYKTFVVVLLVSFIIPQMALAAWWNPFSWKIFNVFRRPQTSIVNTNQNQKNADEKNKAEEAARVKLEEDRLQEEKEAKAEAARLGEIKRQNELAAQKVATEQLRRAQEARELAEQQRLEQERQEAARVAAEQNALIKIEKCKVEAQKNINNFLIAGKAAINEGKQNCIWDRTSMAGIGASPDVIKSAISLARTYCQNIADKALDRLQAQSEEVSNQQYLDCLNK